MLDLLFALIGVILLILKLLGFGISWSAVAVPFAAAVAVFLIALILSVIADLLR